MGIVFGRTGVAEPAYEVLFSRSTAVKTAYEIRQYQTRFAIETTYEGENVGDGFRRLAGYIGVGSSPQNDGGTSISMTAPVVTNNRGKSIAMTAPVVTNTNNDPFCKNKMQFILPAEYNDKSKIPKPTNPAVTIEELPPAVGVIHRFDGWVKEKKAKEKVSALVEQLSEDGLDLSLEEALQKYSLWQYNPPFTIPFLRRNEVWIELDQKQVDEHKKRFAEKE